MENDDLIAQLVAKLTSEAPKKKEITAASKAELVEFWVNEIKSDRFVSPMAINRELAVAILEDGRCTKQDLSRRNISF